MTSSIHYTRLRRDQATSLSNIDRSERVEGSYRVVSGALEFGGVESEVGPWDERELHEYVMRLVGVLDAGGVGFGAWNASRLVGIGSLDVRPVGGDPTLLKLDMLYVNSRHRKRGIGRALTSMLLDEARMHGATALYVSATPTRSTIDAYIEMGAELLATPDPELFRLEPEDVHLVLKVR